MTLTRSERSKRNYLLNKERDDAKNILWQKNNKEKVKVIQHRYHLKNAEKRITASMRWSRAHPERVRAIYLKRQYGITLEEYEQRLNEQKGVCAICGLSEVTKGVKMLSVDHCHKTLKVRGLLCKRCNGGIALFMDNPELLKKAIVYLQSNGVH